MWNIILFAMIYCLIGGFVGAAVHKLIVWACGIDADADGIALLLGVFWPITPVVLVAVAPGALGFFLFRGVLYLINKMRGASPSP